MTDHCPSATVTLGRLEVSDETMGRDGSQVFETVERSVVDSVTADRVELTQSFARNLSAANAEVHQSAVQGLKAEHLTLQQSVVASARVREAHLKESLAINLVAGSASAEGSQIVFLVSPSVKGNVRAVVTPAVAFAFGLGYFVGRRLLGGLLRSGKD